ncbi:MAG: gliding motility-associated C-terminal domain-containing protein [Bacteroidota bacterium]
MKQRALFLLLILACCINSFAQLPYWIWAKGAEGNSYSTDICTDHSGNVLITGILLDSLTLGSTTLYSMGQNDIFIAKYSSSGNLIWAKSTGSSSNEQSLTIKCDTQGNAYISGIFNSSSFSLGNTTLYNSGSDEIFIAKYDANGNVIWAKSIGGSDSDICYSITCDNQGSVNIIGAFKSQFINFGSISLTNISNQYNFFIASYDFSGNLIWVKKIDGIPGSYADIATDNYGNIVITGDFWGSSISFSGTTLMNAGQGDLFIAKYDVLGNLQWAKSASTSSMELSTGIATDNSGNIYITGDFYGSTLTIGTTLLLNKGTSDIFIAKYDAMGNVLWAKSEGGIIQDHSSGIATDHLNNAYITSVFLSQSLVLDTTSFTNNSTQYNFYIAKFDTAGNLSWAKKADGIDYNYGHSISIDNLDNILVVGSFWDSIIFGNTTLAYNNVGIFIAKLSLPCMLTQPTIIANGPTTFCSGNQLTLTSSNALSYLWSDSSANQSIVINTSGLFWVEISDTFSCTNKDSIIINVLPVPVLNLGNDTVICSDLIAPITLNADNSGSTYLWSNGQTTQSIIIATSGIYYVKVTDTNDCSYTDSILVIYKPVLTVNIGDDNTICPGDLITLLPDSDFESYLWSDGSVSNSINIRIPGIYNVLVTKGGCSASDEIVIKECISEIWLPNVITPNGDGVNDLFYPIYKNIDKLVLCIYNRWGIKIFEGSGINALWDGKYAGEICPSGVYYYVLDYEAKSDTLKSNKQLHGSVTLLK